MYCVASVISGVILWRVKLENFKYFISFHFPGESLVDHVRVDMDMGTDKDLDACVKVNITNEDDNRQVR